MLRSLDELVAAYVLLDSVVEGVLPSALTPNEIRQLAADRSLLGWVLYRDAGGDYFECKLELLRREVERAGLTVGEATSDSPR